METATATTTATPPATSPIPAPAATGRPRALDDFKRERICMLVTSGLCIDGAARSVGCAASTIHREARRDPEFRRRLRLAVLECKLGPLNTIRQAALSNWRASAWYLERVDPQQFSKKNPRSLTPEELADFETKLVASVIACRPYAAGQLARKQIHTCFEELDESFRKRDELICGRRAK